MSGTSARRSRATVLVVNDKSAVRNAIVSRLYASGITTIEAPMSKKALLKFLGTSPSVSTQKVDLILLDYSFDDWDTDLDTVYGQIQDSDIARDASIVVLTAYPPAARKHPLVRKKHLEVIDDIKSSPSTVEGIVRQYLG